MAEKKDQKNNPGGKQNKPNPPKKPFNFYWIYAIIGVVLIGMNLFEFNSGLRKTEWSVFENNMLKAGDVKRLVVVSNEKIVEIYIKTDRLEQDKYKDVRTKTFGNLDNAGPHYYLEIGTIEQFREDLISAQQSLPEEARVKEEYNHRKNWGGEILGWLLPIFIMIAIWVFIMRRMTGGAGPGSQIFNIGKSKATLFDKEKNINVTFKDVAGLEEAKIEVQEIVDFLKNPKRYTELGAKIPKGAMLIGPPGTGKTLLAKAVAGEAQVPFFSLSGSDFVEMFVGVGASRVRDLFKQAKEKAPAIIFIDEIDAIGRARGKGVAQGANDERENTLNQLLTEMDGFGTNSGVIIIAATNRADILDRALVRAGRFDRQIHVDLPDLVERKEIFSVHLRPLKLDTAVDSDFLAKQTPGFSGADIANVCNEAALIAARKNRKKITHQDFLDAVDRIIGGLEKKNKLITPQEKKVIAYHEAGHAAVSWLTKYANPLVKVTIVPRGRSLGAAWYLPEERQITTTDQMLDEMCAALGGRAAEEIMFDKVSTGALSDLEKITKQAYAMVTVFGLNKKIGNISFYDSSGQSDFNFSKPYSEKTAETIDEEVSNIIESSYKRTKDILMQNKDKLIALAELLLEKEVIFKDDLEKIFGKRPFDEELQREQELAKKKITPKAAATKTAAKKSTTAQNGTATKKEKESTPKATTSRKPRAKAGNEEDKKA
jgi:cell division protease FtsH